MIICSRTISFIILLFLCCEKYEPIPSERLIPGEATFNGIEGDKIAIKFISQVFHPAAESLSFLGLDILNFLAVLRHRVLLMREIYFHPILCCLINLKFIYLTDL